ncbi:hypothetical protein OKW30_003827 [Paraburkholderia sp. Clong3]
MRFVLRDATQFHAREQIAHGQKIAIPAAVVKGREQLAARERDIGKRVGVGGAQRDRLVDDHVLAGFEGAAREVEVGVVGRRDHDAVEVVEREQRVEIGDDFRVRIVGVRALGLPGRNRGDPRASAVFDHWCVKRRAGEAVAHQSNFQRCGHASLPGGAARRLATAAAARNLIIVAFVGWTGG